MGCWSASARCHKGRRSGCVTLLHSIHHPPFSWHRTGTPSHALTHGNPKQVVRWPPSLMFYLLPESFPIIFEFPKCWFVVSPSLSLLSRSLSLSLSLPFSVSLSSRIYWIFIRTTKHQHTINTTLFNIYAQASVCSHVSDFLKPSHINMEITLQVLQLTTLFSVVTQLQ